MALKLIMLPAGAKKAGLGVIAKIREKTQKGLDKDGKPFKDYSTRKFVMPAGAATKRAINSLKNDGFLSFFTTSKGSTWIVIEGGYARYKKARFPQDSGDVNLTGTGQMLRALTVTKHGNDFIQVGFTREEESKKMLWNIERGRNPMGLRKEEFAEIYRKTLQNPKNFKLVRV